VGDSRISGGSGRGGGGLVGGGVAGAAAVWPLRIRAGCEVRPGLGPAVGLGFALATGGACVAPLPALVTNAGSGEVCDMQLSPSFSNGAEAPSPTSPSAPASLPSKIGCCAGSAANAAPPRSTAAAGLGTTSFRALGGSAAVASGVPVVGWCWSLSGVGDVASGRRGVLGTALNLEDVGRPSAPSAVVGFTSSVIDDLRTGGVGFDRRLAPTPATTGSDTGGVYEVSPRTMERGRRGRIAGDRFPLSAGADATLPRDPAAGAAHTVCDESPRALSPPPLLLSSETLRAAGESGSSSAVAAEIG
jgi:hypothetical protein